jgi:glutamyl-tRNA reductase
MEVKPVISDLMGKAEAIRQAQLKLTLKKLRRLSTEERQNLEAMTKAIVQKILHDPIQHLKNDAEERDDYIRLIAELFQLDRDKSE